MFKTSPLIRGTGFCLGVSVWLKRSSGSAFPFIKINCRCSPVNGDLYDNCTYHIKDVFSHV